MANPRPIVRSHSDLIDTIGAVVMFMIIPAALLAFTSYWYLAPLWIIAVLWAFRHQVLFAEAFIDHIRIRRVFREERIDPRSITRVKVLYLRGGLLILKREQGGPIKVNFNSTSDTELTDWLNYFASRGSEVEWTEYLSRTVREENGAFVKR